MAAKRVFLRAPHGYDADEASNEAGLECKDESLTHQSFAEEADINTLVRRFGIGQVPVVPVSQEVLSLVGAPADFREAMEQIRLGREVFAAQPAEVRSRFLNDPARMLDFLSDERNRSEAEELGLVVKKAPAASDASAGSSPAPAASAASAGASKPA